MSAKHSRSTLVDKVQELSFPSRLTFIGSSLDVDDILHESNLWAWHHIVGASVIVKRRFLQQNVKLTQVNLLEISKSVQPPNPDGWEIQYEKMFSW